MWYDPVLELLSGLGYVLDTPGALTRGLLSGRPGERASGRDMLESWGVLGANQEGLDWGDAAGFGAEMLVDPLNLLMPLAGAKLAKYAKIAGPRYSGGFKKLLDIEEEAARRLGGGIPEQRLFEATEWGPPSVPSRPPLESTSPYIGETIKGLREPVAPWNDADQLEMLADWIDGPHTEWFGSQGPKPPPGGFNPPPTINLYSSTPPGHQDVSMYVPVPGGQLPLAPYGSAFPTVPSPRPAGTFEQQEVIEMLQNDEIGMDTAQRMLEALGGQPRAPFHGNVPFEGPPALPTIPERRVGMFGEDVFSPDMETHWAHGYENAPLKEAGPDTIANQLEQLLRFGASTDQQPLMLTNSVPYVPPITSAPQSPFGSVPPGSGAESFVPPTSSLRPGGDLSDSAVLHWMNERRNEIIGALERGDLTLDEAEELLRKVGFVPPGEAMQLPTSPGPMSDLTMARPRHDPPPMPDMSPSTARPTGDPTMRGGSSVPQMGSLPETSPFVQQATNPLQYFDEGELPKLYFDSAQTRPVPDIIDPRRSPGYRMRLAMDRVRQMPENILNEVPPGSKYLGHGLHATAFETPMGDVLRLDTADPRRAMVDEMLQPTRSVSAGGDAFAERIPRVETALQRHFGGNPPPDFRGQSFQNPDQFETLYGELADLEKSFSPEGFKAYDIRFNPENVGFRGNDPLLLDPGTLYPQTQEALDLIRQPEMLQEIDPLVARLLDATGYTNFARRRAYNPRAMSPLLPAMLGYNIAKQPGEY